MLKSFDLFGKVNNTIAFVLIFVSAVSWSSFGLISSIADSVAEVPPLTFATMSTFFSIFFGILLSSKSIIGIQRFATAVILPNNKASQALRKSVLLKTLFASNRLCILIGYFLIDNKILTTIMIEFYPIITVLLSYHFFKDYGHTQSIFLSWLYLCISAAGLFILFTPSASNISYTANDLNTVGLMFVVLGTIFLALETIYGIKITYETRNTFREASNLDASTITIFFVNSSLCIFLIPLNIALYGIESLNFMLNPYILLLSLAFSFLIDTVSIIFARIGTLMAANHNIFAVYLVAPVSSALLLWVFGFAEVDAVIILSFLLILIPNMLLNLNIDNSFSFKVTFVWILFSMITLFYYDGISLDTGTYISFSSALLVFFALMVGHLMAKINARATHSDQLFMSFLNRLEQGNDKHGKIHVDSAIDRLSYAFQKANNQITIDIKAILKEYNINFNLYPELRGLALIQKRKLYSIGELFIIILISMLLIGITILYKHNNFLYDSYTFIIGVAVIFTLSQIIEKMFFSDHVLKKMPEEQESNSTIVSALFLVITTIAIVLLFLGKHEFQLL